MEERNDTTARESERNGKARCMVYAANISSICMAQEMNHNKYFTERSPPVKCPFSPFTVILQARQTFISQKQFKAHHSAWSQNIQVEQDPIALFVSG